MAHNHAVFDTDPCFTIDTTTRTITDVAGKTPIIMQHDHNSESITFKIERFVDDHDLMSCDVVQIHYRNIEYNKIHTAQGVYEPNDVRLPDDGTTDYVFFSWLISKEATRYSGTLEFSVRFACTDGAAVEYAWSTAICSSIKVAEGIYPGD